MGNRNQGKMGDDEKRRKTTGSSSRKRKVLKEAIQTGLFMMALTKERKRTTP